MMNKDWQHLPWSGSLVVMGLMEQLLLSSSLSTMTTAEWSRSMSWRGLLPWRTSGEVSLSRRGYVPRVLEETPACRRGGEEENFG